ncbi:MAG: cyclase family protein [Nitrososphaerota archaeon]|nr:cyclase family protein [Nitrososphaerota archaeon]
MDNSLHELLVDSPSNWGRWGSDDEIGSLNFLDSAEVLRGFASVKRGKVFSLGTKICDPNGDPMAASRSPSLRLNVRDKCSYTSGRQQSGRGGIESADDLIIMYLQGTTHVDALGHPWYDEKIWNNFDANSTIGSLEKCSIRPIADHGMVGHAVLLDIARSKNVNTLDRTSVITLDDLLECAESERITIQKHDILAIRTGWLELFYKDPRSWFSTGSYDEPGLTYDSKLVEWFHQMEIPILACDTVANEKFNHPSTGILLPLHASLVRNMGILFNELVWLQDLSKDCEVENRWDFLYIASPLKIVGGTASPVNPIAIK